MFMFSSFNCVLYEIKPVYLVSHSALVNYHTVVHYVKSYVNFITTLTVI